MDLDGLDVHPNPKQVALSKQFRYLCNLAHTAYVGLLKFIFRQKLQLLLVLIFVLSETYKRLQLPNLSFHLLSIPTQLPPIVINF